MTTTQGSLSAEDRVLLRDAVRTALERHWPAELALAAAHDTARLNEIWGVTAELGLEGAGLAEALIAIEEFGRAHCPAPLIESIVLSQLSARSVRIDLPPNAVPAFAFEEHAWGTETGNVTRTGSRVAGHASFVELLPNTTHVLVPTAHLDKIAIVDVSTPGVDATATPGLSATPLHRVVLRDVPAVFIDIDPALFDEAADLYRLGLIARALGAVRRAFELVVEHVKVRKQFGQPVGRFQAIQHKLANGLITLDATDLLLRDAAHRFDANDAEWRMLADSALAFAAPALRQLELEIHHTFGAIGFAEEHEAPRHFRRAFGDLSRLGGARAARERLATRLLDRRVSFPDLDLGADVAAFRAEVRSWLTKNWSATDRARERAKPFHQRGFDRDFSRKLGDRGWIAVSWPTEYGGRGLGPLEQFVFMEEMALAGAPLGAHSGASEMIGPALITYGTDEQKREFLPRFLRGELTFSLGYSETESGSDLASLRFKAIRDGDEWVLNGEKLWTSRGDVADYHWLAARTDPQATPPHAGISVFMVPLNAPGVQIRTSFAMYGHTFSSVHYDNVRVPASALVGNINGGWKVITHALAAERILMGSYVATIRSLFDAVIEHIAAHKPDPLVRDRFGGLAAELEVARQLAINGVRIVAAGGVPVHEAAMSKVYSGELLQRITQAAIELLGPAATLGEDSFGVIADGRIEQQLRRSIMMVVGGGTAEIQRNLIATRGLGLPR